MLLFLYASAFTIPVAYSRSQAAVDSVVLQLGKLAPAMVARADRRALGGAVATAAVMFTIPATSFVVRATCGCAAFIAVLVWSTAKSPGTQASQAPAITES